MSLVEADPSWDKDVYRISGTQHFATCKQDLFLLDSDGKLNLSCKNLASIQGGDVKVPLCKLRGVACSQMARILTISDELIQQDARPTSPPPDGGFSQ